MAFEVERRIGKVRYPCHFVCWSFESFKVERRRSRRNGIEWIWWRNSNFSLH